MADARWIQRWESVDTLLFDQQTYGEWAESRPTSMRTADEPPWFCQMSRFAEKADKVVLSDSTEKLAWANSRCLGGDFDTAMGRLRAEPGKDIVVDPPGLGRELTRRGLIGDYLFAVMPVIPGKGRHHFGTLEAQQNLRLVEVKHFHDGTLVPHYEAVRT